MTYSNFSISRQMAVRPKQLTACSLFNIFRDHPQTFVAGITDGAKANGVLGIRECVFFLLCLQTQKSFYTWSLLRSSKKDFGVIICDEPEMESDRWWLLTPVYRLGRCLLTYTYQLSLPSFSKHSWLHMRTVLRRSKRHRLRTRSIVVRS